MALNFPWEMYGQAAQAQNQNRQQAEQDAMGVGKNLNDMMKQIKQQQLMKQLVQAMQQQGQPMAPVKGPSGYTPPNQGPMSTAVPAGQVPPGQQDNRGEIAGLAMQADPSTIGQIMPSLLKQSHQPQGMSPYQSASLDQRNKSLQERQKEFKQMMNLKGILSDLAKSKTTKELKFKIQKYQGDNSFKSLLGIGPTEENVGVGSDLSSMSTEDLQAIVDGRSE